MRTEYELRAALTALERHAPEPEAVLSRLSRPARRRPRIVRPGGRWLTGLAVLAAATAVAVAVAVPRMSGDGRNGKVVPVPAASTAHDVLLRAAASAAAASPQTGRYWRVARAGGDVSAAGTNAHPYAVLDRVDPQVVWTAKSPDDHSWFLPSTKTTTVPATPGAAAAWRAAGSPPLRTFTRPEEAFRQPGGVMGQFGLQDYTLAQFQALPSTAAGLRAVILRQFPAMQIKPGTIDAEREMFDMCLGLIMWDPVTPAVRAAAFRVMAALPDVRLAGKVTDPLGRKGYGIVFGNAGAGPHIVELTVIDPDSGVLLAIEQLSTGLPPGVRTPPPSGAVPGPHGQPVLALPAGTVYDYQVIAYAGWTDAAPVLPPPDRQHAVG